jgi:hypothetical protein
MECSITANGWVYEQVCLAECFKLPINLMANLLIARVMLSLRLINDELKLKHKSSIYFFSVGKN